MSDLAATPRFTWRAPALLRAGIVASLLFLLLGFVSIVWTPYPVTALDVGAAMQDPSGAHWLGTDPLGRDVLSLVMKGTLTSFVVAAVAVAVGALIGVPLGLAAAAWGNIAVMAIGGVSAYLAALPTLVAAILLAALSGPSAATVMVAVGIGNIAAFTIATRDAMRTADGYGYVEAARLAGSSGLDLIRRHTLPSIVRSILVHAVTALALGVMAEATLSYLGIGTQPPATSLGLLLRDAQSYALMKPGLMLVPGLAVLLIVLALNVTSRGICATLDTKGATDGVA
jgi:peptide/nickel transport system permease protein